MGEPHLNGYAKHRSVKSFGGSAAPKLSLLDGMGVGGHAFDRFGQRRGPGSEAYTSGGGFSFARLSYELSAQEAVVSPFSENVFVRAAIKAFSNGLTRLQLGFWNGDPTLSDSQKVEGTALERLIAKPNRRQTGKQLLQAHVTSMKLGGESFWFLANRNGGPCSGLKSTGQLTSAPQQIIQVGGDKVQIDYGKDGWPETFRYSSKHSAKGQSEPFPWYSVVHFKDYNPDDETRGLGDAESAIRPIDLQHQIMRYLDASLRSGGAPSGYLIFNDAMAPGELERAQAEMDDDSTPENANRVKVVDRKATFIPSSFTPKDFEYKDLWNGMTSAILTAMGTPEPVIGIFEHATYENVKTAFLEFWRGVNGVLALAGNTADVLTNLLIPRLVRVWSDTKKLHAHFDSSMIEVLQDDYIAELTLAREISAAGIGMSVNDSLTMLGAKVGHLDAGDMRLVKAGYTDLSGGKFYGPPTPENKEKKAMIADLRKYLESVKK